MRLRRLTLGILLLAATALAARAGEIHKLLGDEKWAEARALMERDPTLIKSADEDSQETPLHIAAHRGQVELVRWLLERGANPNARGYNEFTPLHLTNDPAIAKLLLAHGADVNATDVLGERPLRHAAQPPKPNRELSQLLLAAGADYDLLSAIGLGDIELVRKLLRSPNALPEPPDEKGYSEIIWAARAERPDIVQVLLEHGANPNARPSAWSVLIEVLDHPATVRVLLQAGADARFRFTWKNLRGSYRGSPIPEGSTVLHFAAGNGIVETGKLLLAHGADVHATTATEGDEPAPFETAGWTPLHNAALRGHAAFVRLLLAHGADPKARTADARTAMEIAAAEYRLPSPDGSTAQESAGYRDVMEALRQAGAEPDLFSAIALGDERQVASLLKAQPDLANSTDRTAEGRSPISYAVRLDRRRMAELLLDAGARVNATSEFWSTPLHEAAFWGREDIARLLIARGANVSLCSQSETPLHTAARCGQLGVARLLLVSGADPNARDSSGDMPLEDAEWAVEFYRDQHLPERARGAQQVCDLLRRAAAGKKP